MTWKWLNVCLLCCLLMAAVLSSDSPAAKVSGVGFRLIDTRDHSRYYPADAPVDPAARSLRIYLWYSTAESAGDRLTISDYLRMAADDFHPGSGDTAPLIPVQLEKGIRPDRLEAVLKEKTLAVRGSTPSDGPFPLIVVGQGLYYESPFSQYFLCEYLAGRGYVVVSCPLAGTLSRLVNRSVEDLETQVRDLEFTLGYALNLPYVEGERIGVIGYDMGGMAGLLMCMRHPEIRAFFSLDSGILFDSGLGIPGTHPHYQESRFVIPWMHLTQDRFVSYFQNQQKQESLVSRKTYGANYLGRVPTDNHGCFTAYALMGLEHAVPGYWGPVSGDPGALYREMCRLSGLFFDGYLKNDPPSLHELNRSVEIGKIPSHWNSKPARPRRQPGPGSSTPSSTGEWRPSGVKSNRN